MVVVEGAPHVSYGEIRYRMKSARRVLRANAVAYLYGSIYSAAVAARKHVLARSHLVLPLLHLPVVQIGHAVPTREQRLGVSPLQTPQSLPAGSRGDRIGRLVLPVGERYHL